MGNHQTDFQGDILEAIRTSITDAIPGAKVEATGGGGHFSIEVISEAFEGKRLLDKQRMVYMAIAHLMAGDMAPVHAVDSLKTITP
ncbi:MAG: BolA family transcriptional regulator [Myxococcales bacterium]|nr:BolA family transcriptional regulator [Myxococcales bacterium]